MATFEPFYNFKNRVDLSVSLVFLLCFLAGCGILKSESRKAEESFILCVSPVIGSETEQRNRERSAMGQQISCQYNFLLTQG